MAQAKLPTGVEPKKNSITLRFAVNGKRYTHTLRIPPTKRNIEQVAVRKRLELIEHVALNGGLDNDTGPTVGDYLDKMLVVNKSTVQKSTHTQYERYVRRLKEVFGDTPIDELTVGDVRDFCIDMGDVVTKTISNTISPLRIALSVAVDDGVIATNIIKDWSYEKKDYESEYEVDPFSMEEIKAILEHLPEQIQNFYNFSVWTGLRTSEAIALRWSDVDLENRIIHVNVAKTQYVNVAKDVKTKTSRREVMLLEPAYQALMKQRQFTKLQNKEVFIDDTTGCGFASAERLRRRYWEKACKKANVRYRNPYQTRHTFASMMLSAGENERWVATMMGHKSTQMINQKYGKWIPKAAPDAGKKALRIFG